MAARKAPKKASRSSRPSKRPARKAAGPKRRMAPPARKAARRPARKVPKTKRAPRSGTRQPAAKPARPPAARATPKRPAKATPKPSAKPVQPSPAKAALKPEARTDGVRFTESSSGPLRIALFGASGRVGSRIAQEALARGHHVTAAMRHPERLELRHPNLRAVRADISDPLMVRAVAKGHDALVAAVAPDMRAPEELVDDAKSAVQGTRDASVRRLVWVGGAGSLQVPGGGQLMDSPQFPQEWRPLAAAHRDAMQVLYERGEGLEWTCLSPPALFEPGKRTGKYRAGADQLLADGKGQSRISMEDYAVALVDELERPRNVGRRMTVAY